MILETQRSVNAIEAAAEYPGVKISFIIITILYKLNAAKFKLNSSPVHTPYPHN